MFSTIFWPVVCALIVASVSLEVFGYIINKFMAKRQQSLYADWVEKLDADEAAVIRKMPPEMVSSMMFSHEFEGQNFFPGGMKVGDDVPITVSGNGDSGPGQGQYI